MKTLHVANRPTIPSSISPLNPRSAAFVLTVDWAHVLLFITLGMGAFLRLYHLGAKSLWVDEIGQAWYTRLGPLAALQGAATHVAAAPLDYIIGGLVAPIDSSEFALRLPSALWGTGAILGLYLLGMQVFRSKPIALIAAGLLAISPTHIEYSQELRFYSLFTLLAILVVYTFARAMQASTRTSWVVFGLTATLGVLAHYYTLFVLSLLGLLVLLNLAAERISVLELFKLRKDRQYLRPFAVSLGVALLLVISWYFYSHNSEKLAFAMPPWYNVLAVPVIGFYKNDQILSIWILPALALLGFVFSWIRRNPWGLAFGALISFTIPGVFILLSIFSYFYHPRQILFLVPFYVLLVAAGLAWTIEALFKQSRYAYPVMTFGLLVIVFLFAPFVQSYYRLPKSDWRMTASFLREAASSHSEGIVAAPEAFNTKKYLLYYQPGIDVYLQPETVLTANSSTATTPTRIWLVANAGFLSKIDRAWHKIDLGERLGIFQLYYLGRDVDEQTLWHEFAQTNPPPSLAAAAHLLTILYRSDPTAAVALATQLSGQVDMQSSSLFDSEKGALLTQIARVYFDAGKFDNAVSAIERAYRYSPDDQDTINHVGLIYVRVKRCNEAITILNTSRKLKMDAFTYSLLGNAYRCLKSWPDAIAAYQHAYDLKAEPQPLLAQAQIYIEMNNLDQARTTLQLVIEKFGTSPAADNARILLQRIGPKL